MNFSQNTYFDRIRIWNEFKNIKYVKYDIPEWDFNKRKIFLENIYNSKFVLCPRGNGLDTHRLWETLYLGSIPIVKDEYGMSFFKDLPILFVNEINNNNISEEFLNNKWIEFNSMKKNYDKLFISYWIELIEKYSFNLTI